MRNATRTAAIGLATHAHLATALMNWIQAWDEFDDT